MAGERDRSKVNLTSHRASTRVFVHIEVVGGHPAVPSENHEDYILYHELMHAKDVLEGRFPSGGFFNNWENPELALITSLWHFSIEGKLEKWGKPHKSRQKVVEDKYFWASDLEKAEMVKVKQECWEKRTRPWSLKKFITKELFQKLCDTLWGGEITFQELQSLLEKVETGGFVVGIEELEK